VCRCAGSIVNCLNGSNEVVRFVGTRGVYVRRMRSPVGHNAQHCASVFDVLLEELAVINKKTAWSLLCQNWFTNSNLCTTCQVIKVLYVSRSDVYLPQFYVSEVDGLDEYLSSSSSSHTFIVHRYSIQ